MTARSTPNLPRPQTGLRSRFLDSQPIWSAASRRRSHPIRYAKIGASDRDEPSVGGTASPSAGHDPWFIQLADGRGCGMNGGATYVVAGMRAAYGCADKSVLFGSPDQSGQIWTIHVQAAGSSAITTQEMAAVWY